MSTTAPAPHERSLPSKLLRRLMIAVVLLVVILVPSIVMVVVTRLATGHVEGAATWASMPAIVGLAAVAVGGVRIAVRLAFVLAFVAPLSIIAGQTPASGAALMALLCLMVGFTSRLGLHKVTLLVPVFIAWTLIDPPVWGSPAVLDRTDNAYLLWMAAIWFVGGMFPVLVAPFLLRKVHLPAPKPHSLQEALPYTIIITVLVSVATYYVLDHAALYGGGFLVAAILVLTPLGPADALKPTLIRIAGTLLGVVIIVPIIANVTSLLLIYVIGLVCGIAAVMAKFSPRGWIYYALIVPTSACLNAVAVPQVRQLGEQRLIDNVVGGILVLIAVACSIGYSRLRAHHGPQEPDQQVLVGIPLAGG